MDVPRDERMICEQIICNHFQAIIRRLRDMTTEHWDWSPYPSAPTARQSAIHAWQWLMCDRQHILYGDMVEPVPDPPDDREELLAEMEAENERWHAMLETLSRQDLDKPARQFHNADFDLNVRWFLGHMAQNVAYKSGQVSWVYFALGYDGEAPFEAPLPNPIFEECRDAG